MDSSRRSDLTTAHTQTNSLYNTSTSVEPLRNPIPQPHQHGRIHMSFSQFENPNPYSHDPRQPQPNMPNPGNESSTQFTVLGILFIILALMSFGLSILIVFSGITQYASGGAVPPPNATESERTGFYFGFFGVIVASAVSGLLQSLIGWAGINMLRRKGIGTAKVGAVVMCIPCLTSCGLLGIPIGIWGILALNGQSAKHYFKQA